jgi:hypothetical protein
MGDNAVCSKCWKHTGSSVWTKNIHNEQKCSGKTQSSNKTKINQIAVTRYTLPCVVSVYMFTTELVRDICIIHNDF